MSELIQIFPIVVCIDVYDDVLYTSERNSYAYVLNICKQYYNSSEVKFCTTYV